MSNIKLGDSYDFSKNITNIDISPGFILGLEQVLLFFITRVVEDQSSLGPMFKKFEDVLSGKLDLKDSSFSEIEANIYTIFAIQQLLRFKAIEQNLVIKNDKEIPKEAVKDLLNAYLSKDEKSLTDLVKKYGLT